jgi:basic amino acid/polyamine antiporter, APA family
MTFEDRHDAKPEPSETVDLGLRRTLGPVRVTASGVGIIIGAGIYVLLGSAADRAGPAVWLSFVLAGGLSALTAFSYAELASMFPRSSAEFEYTRQVAPGWVAFLVGWMMIAGMLVAAAAIALGFANYAAQLLGLPTRLVALVLLGVETMIAAAGINRSTAVTVALSVVQVGGLVFVITIGIPHLGEVNLLAGSNTAGILGASALVFFAFIGFDEVITLAEETKNPTQVVPRALLAALGLSTILYVAVAIASVSVIGADALGASARPLADVMAHSLGGTASDLVAIIAALSTFNTSLLALTAGSRLLYGMASSGAMPRRLAVINPRTRAPITAIATSAVVAGGFVLVGDLTLVASVTDFAIYVVFVAVNITVVVLRFRQADTPRPFRTPGTIGRTPVLPVLGLLAVAIMAPRLEIGSIGIGLALGAVGALARPLLAPQL